MNIEEYGFARNDLLVVTAVNAYLKKLTQEARREINDKCKMMSNTKGQDVVALWCMKPLGTRSR